MDSIIHPLYFTMRTLITIITTMVAAASVNAQDIKKAKTLPINRVHISYTPQLYLNQSGLENDGIDPDIISTRNTFGDVYSLEYERITAKNIIMNVGLMFGRQKHDVTVKYNDGIAFYNDIDKDALSQITDPANYGATTSYVGIKLMGGYQFKNPISRLKGWDVESKVGLSLRIATSSKFTNITRRIIYERNDTLYIGYYGEDDAFFGGKSRLGNLIKSYTADLYLGVSKNINWSFVKNVSFGISASHGLGRHGGVSFVNASSYNSNQALVSNDHYYAKDFSIGARLAVGLWPN